MQRALGLQREIFFCVFSSCPVDVQKELRIAVWFGCREVRSKCGVEDGIFVEETPWSAGRREQEPPEHQCGSWMVPGAAAARQEC